MTAFNNHKNNCMQADHKNDPMQTVDLNTLKLSGKDKQDEMIYQPELPFLDSVIKGNVGGFSDHLANDIENTQKLLDCLLVECTNICLSAGIKVGKVESISVNKKLCRCWGRCRYLFACSSFIIELNKDLLAETVPVTSVKMVILHELCHTVPNGHGHTKGWKEATEKLKPFGYQLSRCSSGSELGVPEKSIDEFRYIFHCKKCGSLITRYKASQFVKNYSQYRCGKCGGEIEQLN